MDPQFVSFYKPKYIAGKMDAKLNEKARYKTAQNQKSQ